MARDQNERQKIEKLVNEKRKKEKITNNFKGLSKNNRIESSEKRRDLCINQNNIYCKTLINQKLQLAISERCSATENVR